MAGLSEGARRGFDGRENEDLHGRRGENKDLDGGRIESSPPGRLEELLPAPFARLARRALGYVTISLTPALYLSHTLSHSPSQTFSLSRLHPPSHTHTISLIPAVYLSHTLSHTLSLIPSLSLTPSLSHTRSGLSGGGG